MGSGHSRVLDLLSYCIGSGVQMIECANAVFLQLTAEQPLPGKPERRFFRVPFWYNHAPSRPSPLLLDRTPIMVDALVFGLCGYT
jgi:hypothetical protein